MANDRPLKSHVLRGQALAEHTVVQNANNCAPMATNVLNVKTISTTCACSPSMAARREYAWNVSRQGRATWNCWMTTTMPLIAPRRSFRFTLLPKGTPKASSSNKPTTTRTPSTSQILKIMMLKFNQKKDQKRSCPRCCGHVLWCEKCCCPIEQKGQKRSCPRCCGHVLWYENLFKFNRKKRP